MDHEPNEGRQLGTRFRGWLTKFFAAARISFKRFWHRFQLTHWLIVLFLIFGAGK